MIILNDITIGYKKKKVLEHISYKFEDNGMYAIVGESGIGKTTLLSTIANLKTPLEGHIYYSEDIANLSSSIGYVFQDGNLIDNLTVLENINIMIESDVSSEEIHDVLANLGILKYEDTKIKFLSGGERERVSLALAIIRNSKVIIVDEPTANLDYENALNIFNMLKEMSKERLIIFSSHDMDFVAKYADYIIDLKQSFSNIAYNTKVIEGYYSKRKIKPKFFFNVYRKTNRVNYATMLITSIICTILLAILGFFITLNQHTKAFVITKYIKDNDIPEIVVSKDSLEENNIILDDYDLEYNIVQKKLVSNLSFYSASPNFGETNQAINYIACDETLDDMSVIMTDYSLDILRKANIISFKDYSECIGKKIFYETHAGYYECTICEVKYTGYQEAIGSNSDFDIDALDDYTKMCYQTMYCNSITSFYLFKNSLALNISLEGIKANLINSTDCTDNKVMLSSVLHDSYLKQTGKELNVGDEVSFKISIGNKSQVFSFVYAGTIPTLTCSLYLSDDYYYEVAEALFEFKYDSYIITSTNDFSALIEAAVDNDIDLVYKGSNSLERVLNQIDNISSSVTIAIIIGVLAIFCVNGFAIFIESNNNRYQFSVLENYGINKKYEAYTLILNNFIQYLLELVISSLFVLMIIASYNAYIKTSFGFASLFEYRFKAIAISLAFGLITNILSLGVYLLIMMKRKRASHVTNS